MKERRNSGRQSGAADESDTGAPSSLTDPASHFVSMSVPEAPTVTVTSPTTPFIYPTATTVTGPNGQPIVLLSPGICPSGRSSPLGAPITPVMDASGNIIGGEVDDEFNMPVSVALIILLLYMILGAIIFMHTDDWTFVDSIYFVFISISTVGFGDVTPASEWCMIALSVYLLFGLALTSMCINVIQEQLAVAFEEAKLRLGTTMGFEVDPNTQLESGNKGSGDDEGASGSQPKRNPGSGESNNNRNNKTKASAEPPEVHADPTFDLQKEGIGKNWKERRDNNKKKNSDSVAAPVPSPRPSFSSFSNQYQSSEPGAANLTVDAGERPLTPKRTRSSSNTRRSNLN